MYTGTRVVGQLAMCTVYTCHTVCHLYTTSTRVQLDTFLDVNVSSVPHVHALHVADSVPNACTRGKLQKIN